MSRSYPNIFYFVTSLVNSYFRLKSPSKTISIRPALREIHTVTRRYASQRTEMALGERNGKEDEKGKETPQKRGGTESLKIAIGKASKLLEDSEETRKMGIKYVMVAERKLRQLVEELNASLDALEIAQPEQTVTRIFEELRVIKESLNAPGTGQQKSWSQVAAQPPTVPSVADHRARERARERKDKEIVVTIRDQKERDEIREISQQDLINIVKECCPEITREAIATVRKTPTGYTIKAKTNEGKQAITSNTEWLQNTASTASYREKHYPVVVHSVFLRDTPLHDQVHTITRITEPNRNRVPNLEIAEVRALTNNIRKTQSYGSIIIEITSNEAANAVISQGLALDGEIKLCERYVPEARIRHYTNCQSYGHRAYICKRSKRCANCGDAHDRSECQLTPPPKCQTCGGIHPRTMDICRNRKEEVERTKKAIERTPYLFANETLETQPQPQPQHNH